MAYRAFGTESSGIGAVTYPLPSSPTSWVAGDLLLLVVETGDDVPAAPSGWSLMIDGVIAGQTRLSIFWKIAVAGETAPTVADPGDHQIGHTLAISGVDATRPWDLVAGGGPAIVVSTVTSASAAISCPSVTTTTAGCQIVNVVSVPLDSATWPFSTSWSNAALTGIGSGAGFIGHAAADGNGGAFGGVIGTKATAGATGNTTSTLSSAQQQVLITIALRPPDTSVTGTASITQGADTASAAGSSSVSGAGAATLGADVLAAVGAIDGAPVTGDASIVQAPDTAAAAGSVSVVGSGAVTLGADVLSAAGAGPSVLSVHSVTSAIALFGVTGPTELTAPGGKPLTGGGTIDPDGRTLVPWNPPTSGATFYAVLARPKAAAKTISDNKGNTYSQIGTAQDYVPAANWETAVYEVRPATGGANTIVTIPNLATEEATLAVVALEQANVLHAHVTGYSASAISITSPSVSTSGPGLLLFTFFGDGPTLGGPGDEGVPLVINPTTPGAVVVESRIVNHNGGWIQMWMAKLEVSSAGTYSMAVTQGRAEGGRWYAAAYQTNEFVSGAGAATLAPDALAAAGAAAVSAGATPALGADSAAADGAAAVAGSGVMDLAPDTLAAAGDAASSPVTGVAAVVLGADVAAGAGGSSVAGAGVAALGSDAASSSGTASVAGDAAVLSAPDVGVGAGDALAPGSITGDMGLILGADTLTAAGDVSASSIPWHRARATLVEPVTRGSLVEVITRATLEDM